MYVRAFIIAFILHTGVVVCAVAAAVGSKRRKGKGDEAHRKERFRIMRNLFFLEAKLSKAYAGHGLGGSSGLNALLIMEGKISGVKARGRPRRAWTDDLKDLTKLRNYSELKRTAEDRTIWNALARQPST